MKYILTWSEHTQIRQILGVQFYSFVNIGYWFTLDLHYCEFKDIIIYKHNLLVEMNVTLHNKTNDGTGIVKARNAIVVINYSLNIKQRASHNLISLQTNLTMFHYYSLVFVAVWKKV